MSVNNSHYGFNGKDPKPDNGRWRTLWIMLALLIVILIAVFSSGCNFDLFKSKTERKGDSTAVSIQKEARKDSSSGMTVSKEESRKKEENEWWRIIQQFEPKRGDTTINNFYPQPATIIYEGGKGTKEENTSRFDSSAFLQLNQWWKDKFDSLEYKFQEATKNKESHSSGLGFTALLLVALGVIIIPKLLSWIGSNYHLTKKPK
ncbi:MAG: hypothetical protein ACT4OJ_06235 [Bacteroidota bacterium]